jgi:hypothetical protein
VLAILLAAPEARADRSIELIGGLAVPFVNEDWRTHTEPTIVVGARPLALWSLGRIRVGVEAVGDASVIYQGGHGADLRGRALAGPRIGVMGDSLLLYGRFDIGVDYITSSGCDDGPRLALELGLGITQVAGPWRWGGQVTLPIAVGTTGERACYFVPHVSHDFGFLVTANHAL